MRHWWVNQNKTYDREISGGFLWSPKTKKNGGRNPFYNNMTEVRPGDIVFSYCDGMIKAVGIAIGIAKSSSKTEFGSSGDSWSSDGWLVPVKFKELGKGLRPKSQIDHLRPYLPRKYSPLRNTGEGLQSVYLAAVPENLAKELVSLLGEQYHVALSALDNAEMEFVDEALEESIKGRTDIGATQKEQLIKARRGQGIFKENVRLNEKTCRLTGISDPKHLRASHIKPWSISTDAEKLNGSNGLLLSPHIDHSKLGHDVAEI